MKIKVTLAIVTLVLAKCTVFGQCTACDPGDPLPIEVLVIFTSYSIEEDPPENASVTITFPGITDWTETTSGDLINVVETAYGAQFGFRKGEVELGAKYTCALQVSGPVVESTFCFFLMKVPSCSYRVEIDGGDVTDDSAPVFNDVSEILSVFATEENAFYVKLKEGQKVIPVAGRVSIEANGTASFSFRVFQQNGANPSLGDGGGAPGPR